MDLSKFTERSRGFIQAAQTIAMRESHQRLAPEHLLKALLDDDQGLAANLINAAGGDAKRVLQHVDTALAKLPQVTGDSAQTYMDGTTGKVLAEAEKLALQTLKKVMQEKITERNIEVAVVTTEDKKLAYRQETYLKNILSTLE